MESLQIGLGLSFVAIFLVSVILFLSYQRQVLRDIRAENRLLAPGKVWLQLIPVFGAVFQFTVVAKIADSIRNELSGSDGSDILSANPGISDQRPTLRAGFGMAVLSCLAMIPIPVFQVVMNFSAIVAWIIYWLELRKYHRQIKFRYSSA